jgi:hypothetical protein
MSQQQLSDCLRQRLGYSLSVRPSLIAHQDAGARSTCSIALELCASLLVAGRAEAAGHVVL